MIKDKAATFAKVCERIPLLTYEVLETVCQTIEALYSVKVVKSFHEIRFYDRDSGELAGKYKVAAGKEINDTEILAGAASMLLRDILDMEIETN